jgi:hypothetical protein
MRAGERIGKRADERIGKRADERAGAAGSIGCPVACFNP